MIFIILLYLKNIIHENLTFLGILLSSIRMKGKHSVYSSFFQPYNRIQCNICGGL